MPHKILATLQKAHALPKLYRRIVLAALWIHLVFIPIFLVLERSPLALYNLASASFYVSMLFLVRRGHFRLIVSLTHLEVCIFLSFTTLCIGWDTGFPLYTLALTSLVYFCPFRRKYIPYLFSVLEILLFFLLNLYMQNRAPLLEPLPARLTHLLYLYNVLMACSTILYSAFVSNLTALVNEQTLKAQNASLSELAFRDQLTGLLTRHALLSLEDRVIGAPYALVLCDIDNFKRVNDAYGHLGGDAVLRTVATLLQQHCAPSTHVCRWGGEEFILLFEGKTVAQILPMLTDLCADIAGHSFSYSETRIPVTLTFGAAQGAAGTPFDAVLSEADRLLYLGKSQGKNCVRSNDIPI